MKKTIFTLCCLLATVVFCTQSWAGNNNLTTLTTKQDDPSACCVYKHNWSGMETEKMQKEDKELPSVSTKTCILCCVNAGNDATLSCGQSKVLGSSCTSPCNGVSCPDVFNWSPSTYLNNPNIAQPTAKRCNCVGTEVITYTLTVSHSNGCNPNGCGTTTDQVTITYTGTGGCGDRFGNTETGQETDNENIKVTSNNGMLNIFFSEPIKKGKVEVYDMNGTLVKNVSVYGKSVIEINMDEKSAGIYIIKVSRGKEIVYSKHIHVD